MNKRGCKTSWLCYHGQNGGAKQVGYVITGKTEFDRGDYSGYSTQYIDLWITILTVVDTVF